MKLILIRSRTDRETVEVKSIIHGHVNNNGDMCLQIEIDDDETARCIRDVTCERFMIEQ